MGMGMDWVWVGWDLCAGLFYEHCFAMLIMSCWDTNTLGVNHTWHFFAESKSHSRHHPSCLNHTQAKHDESAFVSLIISKS